MKIKKLIIPISIAPLVTPIITSCNTHPNLQIATTNTDISYPNQVNVVKVVGKLNKTQEIHLISSHDDIVTSSFDWQNKQFTYYLKQPSQTHKKVKLQVLYGNNVVSNILNINIQPITPHPLFVFDNINQTYLDQYVKVNGNDTEVALFPDDFVVQHDSYMKSTWTATVRNMNFLYNDTHAEGWNTPIQSINLHNLTKTRFMKEYNKFLQTYLDYSMNTVIFQVRPMMDAFYKSELNPYSTYLVGSQGYQLDWLEDFDPLTYMISKTHQAGLAYHAWLNPYRVSSTDYAADSDDNNMSWYDYLNFEHFTDKLEDLGQLAKSSDESYNVLNWLFQDNGSGQTRISANPNLVYKYAGGLYLNAGEPDVRQYVVDSIKEILEHYDVDGIHLDDYFYPYATSWRNDYKRDGDGKIELDTNGDWELNTNAVSSISFANFKGADGNPLDYASYQNYGDSLSINDWRRHNNDLLIKAIHDEITHYNSIHPHKPVVFGISPGGIWSSNKYTDTPEGSNTPLTSMSTYHDEFYDSKKWVEEEWMDYICPQLYWNAQYKSGPFVELFNWWANVKLQSGSKTKLYIGHPNYRYMDASDYNYDTQTYRTQLSAYGNSEEILHDIQSASTNIVYEGSIFFSITDLDHNLTYRNQTYHDSLANKISNQANLLIKEIMESL